MSNTANRRPLLAPFAAALGGVLKAATGRFPDAILAAAMLTMLAPTASAAVGVPSAAETSKVQILASVDAAGRGRTIPAGLRIVLDDGWKTYWRSPGDAGMPPRMDWSGSTNVASVAVRWPAPHRFSTFGIETLGYTGEVVLPLDVTVERPGEPVSLRGKVDLLVCSEVCVPAAHQIGLDLPAGPATHDPVAGNLIARFDAQVPGDGNSSGVIVEGAWTDPARGALVVRVASATTPLAAPDAFVEGATGHSPSPRSRLRTAGAPPCSRCPSLPDPMPSAWPAGPSP